MTSYRFETLQLHVGQEQADPATDSRAVPIYQTTSYVFHDSAHAAARFGLADAGNIYGRLTNSTQDVLEKRVAALEGGVAALAVAAGAAAITYTIQALAQAGEHIVAQKTIYGGSFNLLAHTLPLYGIDTTFVDVHDLAEVEAAIQPNTKAIFIETLGNPNSDIPDIDALAKIAHAHGLPLVIDNTFGAAYWVRPIDHGADIVVHSATKFFGGHGTTLGGVIVDSGKFDWKASGKYAPIAEPNPSYHGVSFADAVGPAAFVTYIRAILLRDTGACISPFNAFLLLQGIETLSLRLDRHAENTAKVVEFWPPSAGRKVSHPEPARPSRPRAVQQVLPQRRGLDLHLRHQGRAKGGLGVHRCARDLQPAGERGRREEPRHPPGDDHALAADRRGAARSGHQAQHDPPVHRHRAHRRHHRRPRAGLRRSRGACLENIATARSATTPGRATMYERKEQ